MLINGQHPGCCTNPCCLITLAVPVPSLPLPPSLPSFLTLREHHLCLALKVGIIHVDDGEAVAQRGADTRLVHTASQWGRWDLHLGVPGSEAARIWIGGVP